MAKHRTDSRTSRTKSNRSADAIQMLEADHRKIEKLFTDFHAGHAKHRPRIAQEIFRELEIHSTLEEEIFYPALQPPDEPDKLTAEELDSVDDLDSGIFDEYNEADENESEETDREFEETNDELMADAVSSAYENHRMVRDRITQLRQMDVSDREFPHYMTELQEIVADHVSMEEELFSEAKTSADTNILGQKMQERKADILSKAA